MAKRDWEDLERLFVMGTMDLPELAEQTGIPYSTITKQSSNRDWATKRQVYRNSHKTPISQRLRVIDGSLPPKEQQNDDDDLLKSLELYREQLESQIEITPARSRESLIDAIIKLERVRREWFPLNNEDYLDQVADEFVKRGITLNDFVSRLKKLSAAAD